MREVQAVIAAGGNASRMGRLAEARPKALLPFGTTCLLAHHLNTVRSHGVTRVTILAGHLAEAIESELPAVTPAGMCVDLVVEPYPAGSGGCLRYLSQPRGPLLVVFADIMAWMDYTTLLERHRANGAHITVVVHPNDHPADSDLVETNPDGWVTTIRSKPRPRSVPCRNIAVAGVFVIEPEILGRIPATGSCDLVHHLVSPAAELGRRVLAYCTTEYLKDCGTPDRYAQARGDFESGRVQAQYGGTLRPALFIDRDGTINRHVGYVTKPEQLELLPGAGEAIRRLNQAGILAVLVTNQPVVARGDCSAENLERIHAHLEGLLGNEGAFLDGVYVCPHHPDGGFPGEVADLKVACSCRKPEPGLVQRAIRDLPIALEHSAVVGDSVRDAELARKIGCPAFHISATPCAGPGVTRVLSLYEAVERWLDRDRKARQQAGGS